MKFFCIIVFVLISLSHTYGQSLGAIDGRVVDKSTLQPIPSATVVLLGTSYGTVTDSNGEFHINGIPVNRYTLRVSSIGYESITNPDVVLSAGNTLHLVFELREAVFNLEKGVVVTGEYFGEDPSIVSSVHQLGYEELRRQAGGAEDISRVVLQLPGVMTSSDDRNDLLVRGGNPTENLNIIDNVEVPNINHFGTQGASGGPIGMVNPNFIREVIFSSGGFPVKYGDKLSSVLDIKLREGSRDKIEGDITLNMAGAGLTLEGPMSKQGSWMLSARKSYLDIISKLNTTSVVIVPEYSNFQFKGVYDIDNNNQLSLIGLGGIDHAYFDEGEYNLDSYFKDYEITSDQNQYVLGINYRRLLGKNGFAVFTTSKSSNHFFSDLTRPRDGFLFYRNSSTESEVHYKADINYKFTSTFELAAGFGYKSVNFSHGVKYAGDTAYSVINGIVDTIVYEPLDYNTNVSTSKKFAFLQPILYLSSKLKLIAGVRYDNFSYIDKANVYSYRGGITYNLTDVTYLNLFYGVNYQTPPYIWLTADPSSRGLLTMKAVHSVAGIEHFFDEDIKLSLEFYNKDYSQIPVSRNIPEFIASNGGSDYGAFIIRQLSSEGKGLSRGVELTIQKKLKDNFYGMVSYGYSKTRFIALDGVERDGSFDFRHVFTIAGGYTFDSRHEISFRWRFAGGRPYTPFDPVRSAMLKRGVEDFTKLNSLRYPDYHRLDIRYDHRWHFSGWTLVSYIDIQNIYFRKNIYEYQWDVRENRQVETYQWRFFPVGGFSIEF